MGKLTNKVAIVTGSGLGIGKGIAEALADRLITQPYRVRTPNTAAGAAGAGADQY